MTTTDVRCFFSFPRKKNYSKLRLGWAKSDKIFHDITEWSMVKPYAARVIDGAIQPMVVWVS